MKHGVRNGPPYPLARGAHSASEKKAHWWKSISDAHKSNVKKRKKAKALIKARQTKAKNKKIQEAKNKLINEGTKEQIIKNRRKLTTAEINRALDRIEAEDTLNKRLAKPAPDIGVQKFKQYADKIGDITYGTQKFIDAYNIGAGVYNAIQEYKKTGKKLPQVKSKS